MKTSVCNFGRRMELLSEAFFRQSVLVGMLETKNCVVPGSSLNANRCKVQRASSDGHLVLNWAPGKWRGPDLILDDSHESVFD